MSVRRLKCTKCELGYISIKKRNNPGLAEPTLILSCLSCGTELRKLTVGEE